MTNLSGVLAELDIVWVKPLPLPACDAAERLPGPGPGSPADPPGPNPMPDPEPIDVPDPKPYPRYEDPPPTEPVAKLTH